MVAGVRWCAARRGVLRAQEVSDRQEVHHRAGVEAGRPGRVGQQTQARGHREHPVMMMPVERERAQPVVEEAGAPVEPVEFQGAEGALEPVEHDVALGTKGGGQVGGLPLAAGERVGDVPPEDEHAAVVLVTRGVVGAAMAQIGAQHRVVAAVERSWAIARPQARGGQIGGHRASGRADESVETGHASLLARDRSESAPS